MHVSFEWPFLNLFHQIFTERILLNISPLGRIILTFAQPMMPSTRLEIPLFAAMPPPEISFPKSNPLFNGERQILRRAKHMEVIRHQQIISDQPGRCRQPSFVKLPVRRFVCQPRHTVFGRDCQQNNVVAAHFNMDAGGRIFPADFISQDIAWRIHDFLVTARRSLAPPNLFFHQLVTCNEAIADADDAL